MKVCLMFRKAYRIQSKPGYDFESKPVSNNIDLNKSVLQNIFIYFLAACCIGIVFTTNIRAEESPITKNIDIIVGGDHNYPPYEFLDENGKPTGFNVELTLAIAKVMGMNVEIRLGEWSKIRTEFETGKLDLMQGISYLKDRARIFDFSPPHSIVYHSICSLKSTPEIQSLNKLAGKKVAIQKSGSSHDYFRHNNIAVNLTLTDTHGDALRAMISGKSAYAVVARLPCQYHIKKMNVEKLINISPPVAAQKYGYAVKKGNVKLLGRITEGLAIVQKNGQYQAIYDKWLGVLEPNNISWDKVIDYAVYILTPLLILIIAILCWSWILRKQVAIRTKALRQKMEDYKRASEELLIRQKQLVQADKMVSLGFLVSGVAHEINNPNALFLMNIPILQKVFADSENILQEYYQHHGDFNLGGLSYSRMKKEIPFLLSEILDGARRIKRIVDELKDFARKDDSALNESVHINKALEATVRLVENTIRKSTNHFSVHYDDKLPLIRGNYQRIEQVLINLIVNACQALQDNTKGIFISTSYDSVRKIVQIKVRDEGPGVEAENISYLTDPFYTTKRESGGTGLGLSVSASIIKEHNGEMTFDSSLGSGLTVTLAFPILKESSSYEKKSLS